MKEAIFFCMVGLPLLSKEAAGTPVFKILVRALFILVCDGRLLECIGLMTAVSISDIFAKE